MDNSFFERRKQELGLTTQPDPGSTSDSTSDFFTKRKQALGLIQQPEAPVASPDHAAENKQYTDLMKSAYTSNPSAFASTPVEPQPTAMNEDNTRNLPIIGPLLRGLDAIRDSPVVRSFDYAAGKSMGVPDNMMNSAKSTGNKAADAAINFAGSTAGFLTNPAQIEQNVGQTFFDNPKLQQIAGAAGNKLQGLLPDAGLAVSRNGSQIVDSMLGKSVNKFGQAVVQGGLGGAAYAPFQTLNSGGTIQDIPKNMLEQGLTGAAFGGVLGAASPAVGKAVSELFAKHGISELPPSVFDEANQSRTTEQARGNLPNNHQDKSDLFNFVDQRTNQYSEPQLALPGEIQPTTARISRPEPNIYREKFENLINTANQLEHPPGRELESLQDLWSRMADRTDPSLDELVNLAYPKQREIPSDLAQRAREQQRQREVAGVYGPVKGESDLKVGRPSEAAPEPTAEQVDEGIPTAADGTHLSEPQPIVDTQTLNGKKYYKLANSETYFPEEQVVKANVQNERGVYSSLKESPYVKNETTREIRKQGDTTYTQKTNEETLNNADQSLVNKGIDQSRHEVLENPRALNDEETAVAFKLLQHYQANGDFETAAKMAHKLMTSGTENGRAVQINSIFGKLTPEGALRFASKIVQEAANDPKKTLTPEQVKGITEAAQMLQKANINKDTTRNAINVISKLRDGEKITPEEANQLKQFAKLAERTIPKDERQQYKDLQGKMKEKTTSQTGESAPKPAHETRIRDKVTETTSKLADAARARIKARRGQLNSLPLDEWKDYAIIGADHIAQGARTLADFAEKITDDIGQVSYTMMNRIYVDSVTKLRQQKKLPQMTDMEKIVNRAIATHELGKEEAYALKAKATELALMTNRDAQQAHAMLHQQFNELMDPTVGKKIASLLRSSQLINARTTVRNIIGNMMFYALDTTVRRLSVPVDMALSMKNGNREVFWKNAPDIWKNFFGDVKFAANEAWAGRNPGGLQTQYDLGNSAFKMNGNWFEKTGSFLERTLGVINKSFDYASFNMAMKNELYQLSQAKAYGEGLRGKAMQNKAQDYFHTADDNMLQNAQDYGEYMTFQDKNIASDAAQKLKNAMNLGKDFGLGNIIFNYPKTPANILMRAIDYSPAGYLKFAGNFIKMAVQKDVNKKALIQNFMRASGGTALGWMAYELSKAGLINVLPSQNKDVNSLERSSGIISNSMNIDGFIRYAKTFFSDPSVAKAKQGDSYASMDWLQPMSISASAGAAMAQSQDASRLQTGTKAASAVVQSLEGALESAGNMSVLGNLKQAVMGNGSPNQTVMGRVGDIAAQIPTAFIPSLFGQLRNATDPAVRDTQDPNYLKKVLNGVLNKVPGASKTLPQRYDTLGNPMQNQFDNPARSANAFLNPSLMGKYDPNQAAKVILDLINSTGNQNLAPSKPQQSMKVNGQTVKLSNGELSTLQQAKGQDIQKFINDNMSLFHDPKVPDDQKAVILKALLSAAGRLSNTDAKLNKINAKIGGSP